MVAPSARQCDAVVIGAGVMGSAAAWQLARAGLDVVVVERFAPGHDRGSSHGASRIFRLAYPDPLYIGFARRALTLWGELEEEAGERVLTRTGGIDHGDPSVLESIGDALGSEGVSFSKLDAREAGERWPGLRFEDSVLFQPEGGRIDADTAVAALQRCAGARGVDLRFEERVESLRVEDDGIVAETDRGVVRAPVAVATVGAWVSRLVGGVVRMPPLRITQEQPAYFAPLDPALQWPSFVHRFPPGASEGMSGVGAYGLLTPGEGVKVGEHGTGPVVDPDARDLRSDPAGVARLARYVEKWLPGLDPAPVSVLSCLYTSTPDEQFILDRRGPLVVGSACSGHGFKFAPAVGAVLADLALGRASVPSAWRLRD